MTTVIRMGRPVPADAVFHACGEDRATEKIGPGLAIIHYRNARPDPNVDPNVFIAL